MSYLSEKQKALQYQPDVYMASFEVGEVQSTTTMAKKIATVQATTEGSITREGTNADEYAILSVSDSSGSGSKILVAAVNSLFDWVDNHETYSEMKAVGNNAKKQGVQPIYVCNMHWKSGTDRYGVFNGSYYGMDYWLGIGMGNIHHFYLNTHGETRSISQGERI